MTRTIIYRRWWKSLDDRMQSEVITKAQAQDAQKSGARFAQRFPESRRYDGDVTWELEPSHDPRTHGAH